MKDAIKRLIDQRANTWEQGKALLDAAESEKRDLNADEQGQWDAINADLDKLDQRINQYSDLAKREADVADAAKRFGNPQREEQPKNETRSDADVLRAIVRGEARGHVFRGESRDLTKGTATAGGNTVPTSFHGRLVEHLIENSAIRQTNATVLSTDSGEDIQVPKTTAHSTASLVGEGAAIPESDPTFGQVTIGAFKYALLIQTARELVEDTGVDLVGYLARQAGRAIGNKSGEHMVTGTGTAQPRGVATASTLGKAGATGQTTSVTADDLIDLFHAVTPPYRRNGAWMLNDSTVKAIRKLKDADNQYLWQPGLVAGEPDVLLGKPVVVDPNVAAMAASAKSILFGDFSAYVIRDVKAVEVARSDDFAFNTDLVTWRFVFRTDGDLVDETGAVKHYANSAT